MFKTRYTKSPYHAPRNYGGHDDPPSIVKPDMGFSTISKAKSGVSTLPSVTSYHDRELSTPPESSTSTLSTSPSPPNSPTPSSPPSEDSDNPT